MIIRSCTLCRWLIALCAAFCAVLWAVPSLAEGTEGTAVCVDLSDRLYQTGGCPADTVAESGTEGMVAQLFASSLDEVLPLLGETIYTGLSSHGEWIELGDAAVPEERSNVLYDCYAAVVNDHPELFYVTGRFVCRVEDGYITAIAPESGRLFGSGLDESAELKAVCEKVLSRIEPDWSDLQKYLYLHDYLVTHCEYDYSFTRYSAYDALVVGSSVCNGYALAYKYLCSQAGLYAEFVSSRYANHAWNLVKLGGEYFFVDCTWDERGMDPGVEHGQHPFPCYCAHENFLRSRDGLIATCHNGTDWIAGGIDVYSGLETSSRYDDDAWWRNVYCTVGQLGSTVAYTRGEFYLEEYCLRDLTTDTERVFDFYDSIHAWALIKETLAINMFNTASCFATLDGKLYLMVSTVIFQLKPDGSLTPVYVRTEEERELGLFYGLEYDDGALYYYLGFHHNDASMRRFPLPLSQSGGRFIVFSGSCGDGLTWAIDLDLLLTISGAGVLDSHMEEWRYAETVLVEDGVTGLGERAFNECFGLVDVELPGSLKTIGDEAFQYCTSLQYITIPDSVAVIGKAAFRYCNALRGVDLPSGLKRLESDTFYKCSGLQGIILPDSLTEIKTVAFKECDSLRYVGLPAGIETIEEYAFQWCYSLKDAYFAGTSAQWAERNNEDYVLSRAELHCCGDTALLRSDHVSLNGGNTCLALVYCAPGQTAVGCAASYAADGRFRGIELRPLVSGGFTLLSAPCGETDLVRFFATDAAFVPLCAALTPEGVN